MGTLERHARLTLRSRKDGVYRNKGSLVIKLISAGLVSAGLRQPLRIAAAPMRAFFGMLALVGMAMAVPAQAHLQCAPYAREVSGINLHGNADGWWDQASGIYARGNEPQVGSVLAFRATHVMRAGHVAVVAKVVDARHVLLNHANWSRPGMIEHGAMAEDVSPNGDWSQVRVWYAPTHSLGLRPSPTYGFIYGRSPRSVLANADHGTAAQEVTALADAQHASPSPY